MPVLIHVPCSSGKSLLHTSFSETPARRVHNSCMATKKEKDPVAVEMGRRLAKCRKELDWSQARLAGETGWTQEDADAGQAIGFSPSRIGNYEQGSRRFKIEEAELFGRIFGRSPAYFLVLIDEREDDVIIAMRKGQERPAALRRRRRG